MPKGTTSLWCKKVLRTLPSTGEVGVQLPVARLTKPFEEYMIYSKENRFDAKHLIGKEVKCWSGYEGYLNTSGNVFKGKLVDIEDFPFHFEVVDFYAVYRVGPSIYDKRTIACFEYIKEATDKNGNLTFDFA